MDIKNQFDGMPDFDKFFKTQDEEESWKPKPRRIAAKKLYEQGWKIFVYTELFCESLTGEALSHVEGLILQNATIICPKILGAEGSDCYIILMENASIIRTNVNELLVQLFTSTMFDEVNKAYADVLRGEITIFKSLFKEWVSHFEKDDMEDEWGLY